MQAPVKRLRKEAQLYVISRLLSPYLAELAAIYEHSDVPQGMAITQRDFFLAIDAINERHRQAAATVASIGKEDGGDGTAFSVGDAVSESSGGDGGDVSGKRGPISRLLRAVVGGRNRRQKEETSRVGSSGVPPEDSGGANPFAMTQQRQEEGLSATAVPTPNPPLTSAAPAPLQAADGPAEEALGLGSDSDEQRQRVLRRIRDHVLDQMRHNDTYVTAAAAAAAPEGSLAGVEVSTRMHAKADAEVEMNNDARRHPRGRALASAEETVAPSGAEEVETFTSLRQRFLAAEADRQRRRDPSGAARRGATEGSSHRHKRDRDGGLFSFLFRREVADGGSTPQNTVPSALLPTDQQRHGPHEIISPSSPSLPPPATATVQALSAAPLTLATTSHHQQQQQQQPTAALPSLVPLTVTADDQRIVWRCILALVREESERLRSRSDVANVRRRMRRAWRGDARRGGVTAVPDALEANAAAAAAALKGVAAAKGEKRVTVGGGEGMGMRDRETIARNSSDTGAGVASAENQQQQQPQQTASNQEGKPLVLGGRYPTVVGGGGGAGAVLDLPFSFSAVRATALDSTASVLPITKPAVLASYFPTVNASEANTNNDNVAASSAAEEEGDREGFGSPRGDCSTIGGGGAGGAGGGGGYASSLFVPAIHRAGSCGDLLYDPTTVDNGTFFGTYIYNNNTQQHLDAAMLIYHFDEWAAGAGGGATTAPSPHPPHNGTNVEERNARHPHQVASPSSPMPPPAGSKGGDWQRHAVSAGAGMEGGEEAATATLNGLTSDGRGGGGASSGRHHRSRDDHRNNSNHNDDHLACGVFGIGATALSSPIVSANGGGGGGGLIGSGAASATTATMRLSSAGAGGEVAHTTSPPSQPSDAFVSAEPSTVGGGYRHEGGRGHHHHSNTPDTSPGHRFIAHPTAGAAAGAASCHVSAAAALHEGKGDEGHPFGDSPHSSHLVSEGEASHQLQHHDHDHEASPGSLHPSPALLHHDAHEETVAASLALPPPLFPAADSAVDGGLSNDFADADTAAGVAVTANYRRHNSGGGSNEGTRRNAGGDGAAEGGDVEDDDDIVSERGPLSSTQSRSASASAEESGPNRSDTANPQRRRGHRRRSSQSLHGFVSVSQQNSASCNANAHMHDGAGNDGNAIILDDGAGSGSGAAFRLSVLSRTGVMEQQQQQRKQRRRDRKGGNEAFEGEEMGDGGAEGPHAFASVLSGTGRGGLMVSAGEDLLLASGGAHNSPQFLMGSTRVEEDDGGGISNRRRHGRRRSGGMLADSSLQQQFRSGDTAAVPIPSSPNGGAGTNEAAKGGAAAQQRQQQRTRTYFSQLYQRHWAAAGGAAAVGASEHQQQQQQQKPVPSSSAFSKRFANVFAKSAVFAAPAGAGGAGGGGGYRRGSIPPPPKRAKTAIKCRALIAFFDLCRDHQKYFRSRGEALTTSDGQRAQLSALLEGEHGAISRAKFVRRYMADVDYSRVHAVSRIASRCEEVLRYLFQNKQEDGVRFIATRVDPDDGLVGEGDAPRPLARGDGEALIAALLGSEGVRAVAVAQRHFVAVLDAVLAGQRGFGGAFAAGSGGGVGGGGLAPTVAAATVADGGPMALRQHLQHTHPVFIGRSRTRLLQYLFPPSSSSASAPRYHRPAAGTVGTREGEGGATPPMANNNSFASGTEPASAATEPTASLGDLADRIYAASRPRGGGAWERDPQQQQQHSSSGAVAKGRLVDAAGGGGAEKSSTLPNTSFNIASSPAAAALAAAARRSLVQLTQSDTEALRRCLLLCLVDAHAAAARARRAEARRRAALVAKEGRRVARLKAYVARKEKKLQQRRLQQQQQPQQQTPVLAAGGEAVRPEVWSVTSPPDDAATATAVAPTTLPKPSETSMMAPTAVELFQPAPMRIGDMHADPTTATTAAAAAVAATRGSSVGTNSEPAVANGGASLLALPQQQQWVPRNSAGAYAPSMVPPAEQLRRAASCRQLQLLGTNANSIAGGLARRGTLSTLSSATPPHANAANTMLQTGLGDGIPLAASALPPSNSMNLQVTTADTSVNGLALSAPLFPPASLAIGPIPPQLLRSLLPPTGAAGFGPLPSVPTVGIWSYCIAWSQQPPAAASLRQARPELLPYMFPQPTMAAREVLRRIGTMDRRWDMGLAPVAAAACDDNSDALLGSSFVADGNGDANARSLALLAAANDDPTSDEDDYEGYASYGYGGYDGASHAPYVPAAIGPFWGAGIYPSANQRGLVVTSDEDSSDYYDDSSDDSDDGGAVVVGGLCAPSPPEAAAPKKKGGAFDMNTLATVSEGHGIRPMPSIVAAAAAMRIVVTAEGGEEVDSSPRGEVEGESSPSPNNDGDDSGLIGIAAATAATAAGLASATGGGPSALLSAGSVGGGITTGTEDTSPFSPMPMLPLGADPTAFAASSSARREERRALRRQQKADERRQQKAKAAADRRAARLQRLQQRERARAQQLQQRPPPFAFTPYDVDVIRSVLVLCSGRYAVRRAEFERNFSETNANSGLLYLRNVIISYLFTVGKGGGGGGGPNNNADGAAVGLTPMLGTSLAYPPTQADDGAGDQQQQPQPPSLAPFLTVAVLATRIGNMAYAYAADADTDGGAGDGVGNNDGAQSSGSSCSASAAARLRRRRHSRGALFQRDDATTVRGNIDGHQQRRDEKEEEEGTRLRGGALLLAARDCRPSAAAVAAAAKEQHPPPPFTLDKTDRDILTMILLLSVKQSFVSDSGGGGGGGAQQNNNKPSAAAPQHHQELCTITTRDFVEELQREVDGVRHILDPLEITLYLFPQEVMEAEVVRTIVSMTAVAPNESHFTREYCKMRAKREMDIHSLVLYIPLMVFFLIVVFSGRGLSGDMYIAFGIGHGFETEVENTPFPSCDLVDADGLLNWTVDGGEWGANGSWVNGSSEEILFSPFATKRIRCADPDAAAPTGGGDKSTGGNESDDNEEEEDNTMINSITELANPNEIYSVLSGFIPAILWPAPDGVESLGSGAIDIGTGEPYGGDGRFPPRARGFESMASSSFSDEAVAASVPIQHRRHSLPRSAKGGSRHARKTGGSSSKTKREKSSRNAKQHPIEEASFTTATMRRGMHAQATTAMSTSDIERIGNYDASATKVAGTLSPIGALRIRQQRVRVDHTPIVGLSATSLDGLPSFIRQQASASRYPPFTNGRRDEGPHPLFVRAEAEASEALESAGGNIDIARNRSAALRFLETIRNVTGSLYDGSRFASCGELNGTVASKGQNVWFDCAGHALQIPFHTSRAEYQSVLSELLGAGWIDRQTRVVIVEYLLFHEMSGMLLMAKHMFELPAGGGMPYSTLGRPFFLTVRDVTLPSYVLACYVLFVITLSYLTAQYVLELLDGATNRPLSERPRAWWGWFFDPIARFVKGFRVGDIPSLLTMLLSTGNIALFILQAVLFRGVSWHREAGDAVWQIEYYPSSFEKGYSLYETLTIISVTNITISLCLILRLIKYLPTFASIVGAIELSIQPGVALGVVVIVLAFGCGLCGAVVWGHYIVGYHNVQMATLTLVGAYWYGIDFEYLRLSDQFGFAYVFIIFYDWLSVVFLISCIVAIITDAFSHYREQMFDPLRLRTAVATDPHRTLQAVTPLLSHLRWAGYMLLSAIPSRWRLWPFSAFDDYSYHNYFQCLDRDLSALEESDLSEGLVRGERWRASARLMALLHDNVLFTNAVDPEPVSFTEIAAFHHQYNNEDDEEENNNNNPMVNGGNSSHAPGDGVAARGTYTASSRQAAGGPTYQSHSPTVLANAASPTSFAVAKSTMGGGPQASSAPPAASTAPAMTLTIKARQSHYQRERVLSRNAPGAGAGAKAPTGGGGGGPNERGDSFGNNSFSSGGPDAALIDGRRSTYDYIEKEVFGSHLDYLLTMTLCVFVPQNRFNFSGLALLVDAAVAYGSWMLDVGARTIVADPEDIGSLERLIGDYLGGKRLSGGGGGGSGGGSGLPVVGGRSVSGGGLLSVSASGGDDGEDEDDDVDPSDEAAQLGRILSATGYLYRRLLLGVLACADRSRYFSVGSGGGFSTTNGGNPSAHDGSQSPARGGGGGGVGSASSHGGASAGVPLPPQQAGLGSGGLFFSEAVFEVIARELDVLPPEFNFPYFFKESGLGAALRQLSVRMVSFLPYIKAEFKVVCLGSAFRNFEMMRFDAEAHLYASGALCDESSEDDEDKEAGAVKKASSSNSDDGDDAESSPLTKRSGGNNAFTTPPPKHHRGCADPFAYLGAIRNPQGTLRYLTLRQFKKAYQKAAGRAPSRNMLRRVLSMYPNGYVDWQFFVHVCQLDPFSRTYRSFEAHFSDMMVQRDDFVLWAIVQIPLMVCVFIFALTGYLGEYVTATTSLRETFTPEPAWGSAQVEEWLRGVASTVWDDSSIETINGLYDAGSVQAAEAFETVPAGTAWWSGGAKRRSNNANSRNTTANGNATTDDENATESAFNPAKAARMHETRNYYVGSLRVMQLRVDPISPRICQRYWDAYFGSGPPPPIPNRDPSLNSTTAPAGNGTEQPFRPLRWPGGARSTASPAVREWYQRRIARDFRGVYFGECLSGWDDGRRESKRDFAPIRLFDDDDANGNTSRSATDDVYSGLSPSVRDAFRFRDEDAGPLVTLEDYTYAFQAYYPPRGFYMDIPFNLNAEDAKDRIEELLEAGWVNDRTRLVMVKFVAFNANMQLFVSTRAGYELTAGGFVAPFSRVYTVANTVLSDAQLIGLSVALWFFILMFIGLKVREVFHLGSVWRPHTRHPLLYGARLVLVSPGSVYDIVVVAIIVVVWSWTLLIRFANLSSVRGDGSVAYEQYFEWVCAVSDTIRTLEGANLLLISSRFIFIVTASLKIDIIMKVFVVKAQELLATFLLFVLSLIAFSFCSQLWWGYAMDIARTFEAGLINMVVGASMGGDVQIGMMKYRQVAAPIYEILFLFICTFVLYSMWTAVMTDALAEVKSAQYDPWLAEGSAATYANWERSESEEAPFYEFTFLEWIAARDVVLEVRHRFVVLSRWARRVGRRTRKVGRRLARLAKRAWRRLLRCCGCGGGSSKKKRIEHHVGHGSDVEMCAVPVGASKTDGTPAPPSLTESTAEAPLMGSSPRQHQQQLPAAGAALSPRQHQQQQQHSPPHPSRTGAYTYQRDYRKGAPNKFVRVPTGSFIGKAGDCAAESPAFPADLLANSFRRQTLSGSSLRGSFALNASGTSHPTSQQQQKGKTGGSASSAQLLGIAEGPAASAFPSPQHRASASALPRESASAISGANAPSASAVVGGTTSESAAAAAKPRKTLRWADDYASSQPYPLPAPPPLDPTAVATTATSTATAATGGGSASLFSPASVSNVGAALSAGIRSEANRSPEPFGAEGSDGHPMLGNNNSHHHHPDPTAGFTHQGRGEEDAYSNSSESDGDDDDDDDGDAEPPLSTIEAYCYSQRTFWQSMHAWWFAVDAGAPRDVAAAAGRIFTVQALTFPEALSAGRGTAGGREGLSSSDDDDDDVDGDLGGDGSPFGGPSATNGRSRNRRRSASNNSGGTRSGGDSASVVSSNEAEEDGSDVSAADSEAMVGDNTRLHTYGRFRRLPIWNEYLFTQFRGAYVNIRDNLIDLPAALFGADGERLWLRALEDKHYFDLQRRKYVASGSIVGEESESDDDDESDED